MKKSHFNSLPAFSTSQSTNVDRENDVLRNVEIAKFGKNKNYSYFNQQFLDDLVIKGNEQKQGVKSRFGHPNMCASSLGTYIGRFKEFSQNEGKVYANLYLDAISKKTQVEGKGITMYDYIMDMSERNPDMFGNSVVVMCDWFDEEITNEAGEKETVESLILEELVSSDLVDDPAATDALFSSNPNDLGVILTDFLDNNPQVFSVIDKNPNIIADFFSRYANYSTRKSNPLNMNVIDRLKKAFSTGNDKFDIDLTLADGSIVKVITDAEQPKVGDKVTDSDGAAVGEGEHLLPDGGALVTDADGTITEIKDAPATDPASEETTPAEVMNSVNALSKKFDTFLTGFAKIQKDNEAAFELIGKEFGTLSGKVALMGKNITSKDPKDFSAEPTGRTTNKPGAYDPEKAKEHHKIQ